MSISFPNPIEKLSPTIQPAPPLPSSVPLVASATDRVYEAAVGSVKRPRLEAVDPEWNFTPAKKSKIRPGPVIGRGTTSTVYQISNRPGSPKVMKVSAPGKAQILAHEMSMVQNRAPHGIRLRDTEIEPEEISLIYDEIPEVNLSELVRRKNHFSLKELKLIAYQHLEFLAFLEQEAMIPGEPGTHRGGMVHGDIKPQNSVFEKSSNRVTVLDYGLSDRPDLVKKYPLISSRIYRAPEVVLGLKYDTKADLWSLGCLLYELCVGRRFLDVKGTPERDLQVDSAHLREIFNKLGCEASRTYYKEIQSVPTKQGALVDYLGILVLLEQTQHPEPWDDHIREKLANQGSQNVESFIRLIQRMISYDKTRALASTLLKSAFFKDVFNFRIAVTGEPRSPFDHLYLYDQARDEHSGMTPFFETQLVSRALDSCSHILWPHKQKKCYASIFRAGKMLMQGPFQLKRDSILQIQLKKRDEVQINILNSSSKRGASATVESSSSSSSSSSIPKAVGDLSSSLTAKPPIALPPFAAGEGPYGWALTEPLADLDALLHGTDQFRMNPREGSLGNIGMPELSLPLVLQDATELQTAQPDLAGMENSQSRSQESGFPDLEDL